jgi:excisionase family DNA binding protein
MITYETHEHEYCTVAEVAQLLRVSKPTVWRWIASGRLPAVRRGPRAIRVRRADLYLVTQDVRPRHPMTRAELEPYIIRGGDPTVPWQEVLDHIRQTNDRILARRGGKPLDSSLPLIHEARSERDEHL